MKKTFVASALLATTFVGFAQNAKVKFVGKTDTIYNGSKLLMYNNATKDKDSAIITNGRFEISVNFKEPTRYYFYSDLERKKKGGYAPYGIIVTKPSEVTIKVNMDSMQATTVTGAPENDLYNAYVKESSAANKKIMDKLGEKYGKEVVAHPDPKSDQYKQIVADYQQLAKDNQPAEKERLKKFIQKNPSSFSALLVLSGAANSLSPADAEELFAELSSTYKETAIGKRVAATINAKKITAIGKQAPEFEQTDTAGNIVKLTSFKGKYVLIDFWASWCGPCRAENPNVVKNFEQFKEKGFTVLGVSLDQPGKKDAWLKAIYKDNLAWAHVSDLNYWDNAVAKLYGIQSIPQNFLLDPQGKIIAVNVRGDALSNKLKELFIN